MYSMFNIYEMKFVDSFFVFVIINCVLRLQLVHCGTYSFVNSTFVSIWNSPTRVCDKIGIPLNLSYFDIIANTGDTFEGDEIVIFYKKRLGLYPWIDDNGDFINGGLPQLADLNRHLSKVAEDISMYIPDVEFNGLAIIDWESWRPIFDRNGYNQEMKVYIEESKSKVHKDHPYWPEEEVENEARQQFESGARTFMQATLESCKKLRPGGRWGFYGFPSCYNNNDERVCSNKTLEMNNSLDWLFNTSTALYPSIYLNKVGTHTERYNRVYGQLHEAQRIRRDYSGEHVPIFTYTRYRYSNTGHFYDKTDLSSTIGQVAETGLNGVVLWDSSASFRNPSIKCLQLRKYLNSKLGPYVKNVTCDVEKCGEVMCNSQRQCLLKHRNSELDLPSRTQQCSLSWTCLCFIENFLKRWFRIFNSYLTPF